MFLMMLITLYTSRVTLNCLGISDYGIYNIVGGVVTMFSFINSSMAGSIQRFLNIAIEKKIIQFLKFLQVVFIFIC